MMTILARLILPIEHKPSFCARGKARAQQMQRWLHGTSRRSALAPTLAVRRPGGHRSPKGRRRDVDSECALPLCTIYGFAGAMQDMQIRDHNFCEAAVYLQVKSYR